MTPPVVRSAHVRRPPAEAFALFTDAIGRWWPMASHSVYGADATVRVADGLVVERSADGEESVWGRITTWQPPHRLVLDWHPGRPPEEATEVEVVFLAAGDGTRVELEHRGWERFGGDAEARRRGYAGPNAWGAVLDHYTALADVPA
jgi:uncharacterized protein YndB with AHSA1/START domain